MIQYVTINPPCQKVEQNYISPQAYQKNMNSKIKLIFRHIFLYFNIQNCYKIQDYLVIGDCGNDNGKSNKYG